MSEQVGEGEKGVLAVLDKVVSRLRVPRAYADSSTILDSVSSVVYQPHQRIPKV
jgi:hypothetical protein